MVSVCFPTRVDLRLSYIFVKKTINYNDLKDLRFCELCFLVCNWDSELCLESMNTIIAKVCWDLN